MKNKLKEQWITLGAEHEKIRKKIITWIRTVIRN